MLRHTRTALAAILLAVAATTFACADAVDDDLTTSTPTGRAITSALLSSSDLPGFEPTTEGEPQGLPNSTGMSCLSEPLDASDPLDSAEVTYADDGGFPAISNEVEVYRDELEVERVMAELRRGIEDCEQAPERPSAVTASFDVTQLSLPVPTGVDDQIAVTAQGSADAAGLSVDVGLSVAVASVGRFITVVAVVDGGDEDSPDLLATFVDRAETRLLDAGAGSL